MLVLFVVYLSVGPAIPLQLPVQQGDKLSHVVAYLVLMSWFANIYRALAPRAMFALAFVALAIGLEFIQLWMGNRTFEVADMVAGAAGVAAGWLLAPPRLPGYLLWVETLFPAGRKDGSHGG